MDKLPILIGMLAKKMGQIHCSRCAENVNVGTRCPIDLSYHMPTAASAAAGPASAPASAAGPSTSMDFMSLKSQNPKFRDALARYARATSDLLCIHDLSPALHALDEFRPLLTQYGNEQLTKYLG